MNTLPALLTAVMLVSLPSGAAEEPRDVPMALIDASELEAVETAVVPEPRSLVFVGLGALLILAFTMRRK